ncbi:MAG: methyltransferase domain-containing protein [Gammaproteobacteria bacterium]|nr:methyltransferase domain-containing protein [Gammaproteobacteria bacterium]
MLTTIVDALASSGRDLQRLRPADLAPVDAFHMRGREATTELAGCAGFARGKRVLDVGCGIGGSVRYLAHEHGCRAIGIDLTPDFVTTARALAALVGLGDAVRFLVGRATALPFADGTFANVWTEHVQMNVADKARFYAEAARVLAPGGRLVFHDVFEGPGGVPHYPVPWAADASISFLATPQRVRALLGDLGLRVLVWEDRSERSLAWFEAVAAKHRAAGPPALGVHLLMGPTAPIRFANVTRNLREGRVVVIQAVLEKH